MLGSGETAAAVAVGAAVLLMLLSRAVHPPVGIDALLVASHGLPASWLVSPVLAGALLLVGYAKLWSMIEQAILARTSGGSKSA